MKRKLKINRDINAIITQDGVFVCKMYDEGEDFGQLDSELSEIMRHELVLSYNNTFASGIDPVELPTTIEAVINILNEAIDETKNIAENSRGILKQARILLKSLKQ